MTGANLTIEQLRNFNLIELRIVNQRYIEILDDLYKHNLPTNNKKLRSGLKAIYDMLDKETKKYNELYEATPDGVNAFYDIIVANSLNILNLNLLDKNLINRCLLANERNPKAFNGIIDKIIKEKQ